jgi:hypothetical protein
MQKRHLIKCGCSFILIKALNKLGIERTYLNINFTLQCKWTIITDHMESTESLQTTCLSLLLTTLYEWLVFNMCTFCNFKFYCQLVILTWLLKKQYQFFFITNYCRYITVLNILRTSSREGEQTIYVSNKADDTWVFDEFAIMEIDHLDCTATSDLSDRILSISYPICNLQILLIFIFKKFK